MKKLYVCLLLFSVNLLNAVVLYSQIPDTLSAIGYRCQRDTVYLQESDIADDIVPTGGGWRVDSVVAWFQNWSGFDTWNAVPDIHFLVYQDSSGQPVDSPMLEMVVYQTNYTAYLINMPENRWRVELDLPSSVSLDTFRYWIEVQPSCHDFGTNGKTGHQAQVDIGNGQDFYMRFPQAGIPTWESASSLFGQALETGFMLIGEEMGIAEKPVSKPTEHYDLGATIVNGPLLLPEGKNCSIFDITGRVVLPQYIKPGVYFIEVDGMIRQKVVKVR
jgi:hypothetical protein